MSVLESTVSAILGIATLAGMAGTAFYAFKLLGSLRNGVLEKGWKFIVFAAFCLIFGITTLDLSVAGIDVSNTLLELMGCSGAVLQAIGAITIAYGFKTQYDAWNPKEMRQKNTTEKAHELSLQGISS